MSLLATAVRIAEETEFDPDTVSPGVAGFIAFAALGIGIIALGFNMVRRLRRNSYRAEVREQIEQELAEQNGTVGSTGTDPQGPSRPVVDPDADPSSEPGGGPRAEPGTGPGAEPRG
ncbi:hypothetical protein [Leucobacter sp. L43]|uniref:hypothetical protein n=1 Tax=Leucobacter sp. L43 TaxID=2798040 RepID=UPI001908108B|nr:hypothetical protein [Leucobacter sp. L43]